MANKTLKSIKFPNLPDTYIIPQGTVTEADLEEAEGTKADAIVLSASGDIASYDDGGDLPMKSLKVNIVPKQSGTGDPSPDNVRAISGTDEVGIVRSAINLWDEEWEVGAFNATGGTAYTTHAIRSKNYIPVRPLTEYRLLWSNKYGTNRAYSVMIIGYDRSKNFVSNIYRSKIENAEYYVFTVPSGVDYIKISVGDWLDAVVVTNYANDISVNYPSTDTEYHKGATPEEKSITLPPTVYGGTLDVVSGKLVIDRYMLAVNGGEAWQENASDYLWVSTSIPFCNGRAETDGVCSHFIFGFYDEGVVFMGVNTQTGHYIALHKTKVNTLLNISTLAEFKNYLASQANANSPLQVAYKLATPTEIDLTPTEVKSLLGDNNVWSDSGTVEVEYRADTSLVINKILEALA